MNFMIFFFNNIYFDFTLTCFSVCYNYNSYDFFFLFFLIIFILDNILTLTCFLISAYFIDVLF